MLEPKRPSIEAHKQLGKALAKIEEHEVDIEGMTSYVNTHGSVMGSCGKGKMPRVCVIEMCKTRERDARAHYTHTHRAR